MLIVWILLAFTVPFTNNDTYTNILIAIIAASILFHSVGGIDFYFQANVLSKYTVLARMIAGIIVSVVKVGLVLTQASLIWFVLVFVLYDLMIGVFYLVAYRVQKLSVLQWRFDWAVGKQILKDSWPLLFAGLMIVVYLKIDQVMLKNLSNVAQVGIYAVAVRLSEVWYFIPVLISQSVFPAVINAKKSDRQLYEQRMQHLYDLMTFASLSIAIIITLGSGLIMNILFGQAYSGSDKVLAIHIWAGVFVFFGTARGKWIIAENLQKKALIVHTTGAVLNIILNLLFIPRFGAVGAALATLISYSTNAVITSIIIREFRKQFVMYMKSFPHCITLRVVRKLLIQSHAV
jgi:O-antigen/teichoic acid export membrane protein